MTEKFTFFWSGIYSQWHPAMICLSDDQWPKFMKSYASIGSFDETKYYFNCNEQYMMARKAWLFYDEAMLWKIMAAVDPADQKRFGRMVSGFDKDKWEQIARDVVFKANWAKFTQHPDLKEQLLKTVGTTIVEASPTDTIWGIGLSKDDPRAQNRATWRGTNWLGEAIMQVRDKLLKEKL